MGKVTKAASHLSEAEIQCLMKQSPCFWRQRRWLIIHSALVAPSPAVEIAQRVGVSTHTVHQLISRYNRLGPEAIETPGKAQRQRAYLSLKEEEEFLSHLTQLALKGQLTTVAEIKITLEERLSHPVHQATVYRLLSRHEWKKKAPRPRHTAAEKNQQEEFKKTSLRPSNSSWLTGPPTIPVKFSLPRLMKADSAG